ncbi:MAG: DsbA family protein, partial [Alphaproteobacteria bacterium]|nr:DsbA family protein [Alphaproteobacteria bacterium]
MMLAGCSSMPITTVSPSQSGTLVNAAAAPSEPAKPFNPFAEDEGAVKKRFVIENPTIEQVMQPGPLPERSLGRPDAPITVIKYASMTCPYCRHFHLTTFPELKRRYIDTGKIRFILREFPIGFQSGAATIALRCVPGDKYFEAYTALMKNQNQWMSQEVRHEPIWKVVKPFGLSRAE